MELESKTAEALTGALAEPAQTVEDIFAAPGADPAPVPGGMPDAPADGAQPGAPAPGEMPDAPAAAPGTEELTLKFYGQELRLPRADVVALAQKGLDYDKVRAERDALRGGAPAAGESLPEPGAPWEQQREQQRRGLLELLGEYPELRALPPAVVSRIRAGETPLSAYRAYELAALRAELAARRADDKNRAAAVGSAASLGKSARRDPFEEGFDSAFDG